MKKYLISICCLMAVSVIFYPQFINANSNRLKSTVYKQTSITKAGSLTTPDKEPKKVFMHYMGWYGGVINGRHWEDGQPREPLIGYYNSQSWATQMYHILLSWSCGIDGLVINVKDAFDTQTMKMLTPTLKRIRDIDSINFNYQFAISYDDQGMVNIDTAKSRFTFLKESILPNNPSYLTYNDTAVVFIYNYNDPPYLSAANYDSVLDLVFQSNRPKVFWNEIDSTATKNEIDSTTTTLVAASFYPWVKPNPAKDWRPDGSNWGKGYPDWFYRTMAINQTHDFVIGGVWPGFDDRSCSWGQNRWMNRYNGAIYDSTWNYIKIYDSLYPTSLSPLKWVYIETWNDWNEGSEIEPSEVFGYKYLLSTIKNINVLKDTIISANTNKFLAATKIYEAADLIEQKIRDTETYYPLLKSAIKFFILDQIDSALCKTYLIIDGLPQCCDGTNSIEFRKGKIEIYPNPAKNILYIRQQNNDPYSVVLTHIQGKVMLYKEGSKQLETIDISQFPKGIYLVRVKRDNLFFDGKIVVP
jgi:hypothetical protein